MKTRNSENVKFVVFNCLLCVVHCAWLIYGNTIYWSNSDICAQELAQTASENITWIMLAQIVIGYIPLIKCCSFTTLVLCFGPAFLRALRRARRPDTDWVPTGADIMKDIYKEKFSQEDHPEGLECSICMVEYEPEDEIIPLPCDTRHFFHADCIANWLKQNNSCPLCKKPVTKDDLKKQKKSRHKEMKQKKPSEGVRKPEEEAKED